MCKGAQVPLPAALQFPGEETDAWQGAVCIVAGVEQRLHRVEPTLEQCESHRRQVFREIAELRRVAAKIVKPTERRSAVNIARQAVTEQALRGFDIVECRQLQCAEPRGSAKPHGGTGFTLLFEQCGTDAIPVVAFDGLVHSCLHFGPTAHCLPAHHAATVR